MECDWYSCFCLSKGQMEVALDAVQSLERHRFIGNDV